MTVQNYAAIKFISVWMHASSKDNKILLMGQNCHHVEEFTLKPEHSGQKKGGVSKNFQITRSCVCSSYLIKCKHNTRLLPVHEDTL